MLPLTYGIARAVARRSYTSLTFASAARYVRGQTPTMLCCCHCDIPRLKATVTNELRNAAAAAATIIAAGVAIAALLLGCA